MTTEDAKNEVIIKANNALAAYNVKDDYEGVRQQDIITPRIRLQQLTSPAVGEGKAAAGDFMLDNTEMLLRRGNKTKIIPLMNWLQWVEFNPDRKAPKDKRVLSRSVDPVGELAKSAEKYEEILNPEGKKQFRVTESFNFAVLLPSVGFFDTVYILSFQRSGIRVAKGWLNTLLRRRQSNGDKMPWFSAMFDLSSVFKDEGGDRKYFVPSIDNMTETPMEQWPGLAELVTKLRAGKKAMMERELEREHELEATEADAAETAKAEKHF
jgi:hypothetical protein